MKIWFTILCTLLPVSTHVLAQVDTVTFRISESSPWSHRIAESFLLRHPGGVTYDTGFTEKKWNYEQGLILWALYQMSLHTGEAKYFDFVIANLSQYVDEDGRIRTYKRTDYNLDLVAPGRALLAAYQQTGQERFRRAADTLHQQLKEQPRTNEGGFWHKKIYPNQMWLDGLYMAEPFYAWYTQLHDVGADFDDIINQFAYAYHHTRDTKTGLCYHGWDESRKERWSDPATGQSQNFWSRSLGWYMMGLVDVLDYIPPDHPRRAELLRILEGIAEALVRVRDDESGLWFQVVDKGSREGNYLESSGSAMFAYAFAKGANEGYLHKEYMREAERTFEGLARHAVTIDPNGFVDLHNTCKGTGLGGKPYRDGSYEYYISEPVRSNDIKGIGPFLLAAIELERAMAGTSSR